MVYLKNIIISLCLTALATVVYSNADNDAISCYQCNSAVEPACIDNYYKFKKACPAKSWGSVGVYRFSKQCSEDNCNSANKNGISVVAFGIIISTVLFRALC
uniref:UPAR/Ly6 domain-containing protein n=1 Tax=Rhabditophanes sp. KR3021 TaxID=114890 RepID=A0AC35UB38_9BILA